MKEAIPYYDIKQKKVENAPSLSDQEAMTRALDLIDFYAAICNQDDNLKSPSHDHAWIELEYKTS
ncbi:MAG: hypothetical protein MJA30_18470 [Cytophagales bacterium]|nr:hypothetical protein [Cytophagales bacterium]